MSVIDREPAVSLAIGPGGTGWSLQKSGKSRSGGNTGARCRDPAPGRAGVDLDAHDALASTSSAGVTPSFFG